MRVNKATSPANGERRAIGGYVPQYRISSYLILRSLRKSRLQWIRVADPEAGRVDDLQIGSHNRIDAFQVKWNRYGGNFTFNDLIKPSKNKPSLIAQLSDGWKRLRMLHSGHHIVVHLLTNETPSSSDNLPVCKPIPTPKHFAAFIEQVWKPIRSIPSRHKVTIPQGWQEAWDVLQKASGLTSKDFLVFVKDCELEFEHSLHNFETVTSREQLTFQKDIDQLCQFLFETIAGPEKITEMTLDQLLQRLNWKSRFEFKSRHEFPEPDIPYQPVKSVVNKLNQTLSNLPGGYIALIGTPGSGKSTLLTQTLRNRPERVIRYYVYVPDAQEPLTLRGESVNFLHDICLAIEHAGFHVGKSPSMFERDQLSEQLHQQIQLLHQDWKDTGRKTIIVIDGLDHISRETTPSRSLLNDLPLPEQIPDGVYFILGSQTDQLKDFPSSVQYEIQKLDRRIEMQPLNREAVIKIVERPELLLELIREQKDKIFELSGGHPLALSYILNHLKQAKNTEELEKILQNTIQYEGNIERQYYSYWKQIENDCELVKLLGLLVRMRRFIDVSWIKTWYDPDVVARLERQIAHYFRRETNERWYFFHNSFRLFLLQKTAETIPGNFNFSFDQKLHHELAEKCSEAPTDLIWSWEELYHRISANEHKDVLKLASPEWFRNQFLGFRPNDVIKTDIQLALKSAVIQEDAVALTRLILIGSEIAQREFNLENTSIIPLLIDLDKNELAIEYVRDGNRLRINTKEALRISVKLRSLGFTEEARKIFELAEPLDLLSSSSVIKDNQMHNVRELLKAWADAVVYFRDLDSIIGTIKKIRCEPDRLNSRDAKTETRYYHNYMLFRAGLGFLEQRRWKELEKINKIFDLNHKDNQECWFWLKAHSWRHCRFIEDNNRAKIYLEEALNCADKLKLNNESCLILAEGIYLILKDKDLTIKWLENIPQPKLKSDLISADPNLNPFLQRFRLNRLLYTLGNQQAPSEIVPDDEDPRNEGIIYFERAICVIARIWAYAWRGQTLDFSIIEREIFPLLRLYNRNWEQTREWNSWHVAQRVRSEFYELLVNAVSQHGQTAIYKLCKTFENEWDSKDTKAYWPADVCRRIIITLYNIGGNRTWANKRLYILEKIMLEGQDISSSIEECGNQARAWIAVSEKESAFRVIKRIFKISFGVSYEKDYQLNTWIEWLDLINKFDSKRAAERIKWFAKAIISLEKITGGDACRVAANKLLEVACQWSPRKATFLFHWFIDRKIIRHEEATQILLRQALKSDNPPYNLVLISLIDFLLPIASDINNELLVQLVKSIVINNNNNNEKAIKEIRYIVSKVKVHALPSIRSKWYNAIANTLRGLDIEFQIVGIKPVDLKLNHKDENSSEILKLKDNSTLTLDEVKSRVNSISDLKELLKNEVDGSYFHWKPILAQLVENLDRESIFQLSDLFQGKNRFAQILSILSKRLYDLGYLRDAWSLGKQAFHESDVFGWDRWWDGGSRLDAFKALNRADTDKSRPLVYKTLFQDMSSNFGYTGNISRNLIEIIPLLSEPLPIHEIWSVIEEHVKQLLQSSPVLDDEPIELTSIQLSNDSPHRAIADLIMNHLNHPVSAVSFSAQKACAKLLLDNNSVMQETVQEYLDASEDFQEKILMILDSISLHKENVVKPFQDKLINLHQSSNYAIQHGIEVVCRRLRYNLPSTSSEIVKLPAIYQLSIPLLQKSRILKNREISSGEPLPDSDNPVEIVRPFDFDLGFIAKMANLPKINLCYRAIQVMRQLAPEETWSAKGERKLRAILDSAGLRLPFQRPRSELARRAMFHVISELVDANLLKIDDLNTLEPAVRFYDPYMFLVEPAPRPTYISKIVVIKKRSDYEEWIEKIDETVEFLNIKTTGGQIILAEETTLKRLEWKIPTEIRITIVRQYKTTGLAPDQNDKSFFTTVLRRLVSEYPTIELDESILPIIIHHTSYGYDFPGSDWLALNPSIGSKLGWYLSDNGLFRWLDDKGEIMVESVWWKDGLIDQAPPHLDDEVGEGWLVVASPVAWDALKKEFSILERSINITRKFNEDGETIQKSFKKEQIC